MVVPGPASPNITNCVTGAAVEGLGVVEGIIMITNYSELRSMEIMRACVGGDDGDDDDDGDDGDDGVVLEMVDSHPCSHNTWCAQIETQEECATACHQLTGWDHAYYFWSS